MAAPWTTADEEKLRRLYVDPTIPVTRMAAYCKRARIATATRK